MCSFAETTHTPQGDGNIYPPSLACQPIETTHTPQGDGNMPSAAFLEITAKQPTPRKGTETILSFHPFTLFFETTHTPQGDGNLNLCIR